MVAVAIAVIIGYAAYYERGYMAVGGEGLLQIMCLGYAVKQFVEIIRRR